MKPSLQEVVSPSTATDASVVLATRAAKTTTPSSAHEEGRERGTRSPAAPTAIRRHNARRSTSPNGSTTPHPARQGRVGRKGATHSSERAHSSAASSGVATALGSSRSITDQ